MCMYGSESALGIGRIFNIARGRGGINRKITYTTVGKMEERWVLEEERAFGEESRSGRR